MLAAVKTLFNRNVEFWTHERSLTALLVYLSLTLFLSLPLSGYKWLEFIAVDVLFMMTALSGIFAVKTHLRKQLPFLVMAISAVFVRVGSFFSTNEWLAVAADLITVIFYVTLIRLVLNHIFKDGPVNFYRIQGSLVVFILTGMIGASFYDAIYHLNHEAFRIQFGVPSTGLFIYFSFVTMTTLGFGDILPVAPIAKSLAIFQGMIGLLYPVIIVARLVAMELEHKRNTRQPN